uniref:Beta-galactosidase n=1 Tax=Acrobeloides nanus TaxID=290746 RepID=A0A914E287_9BILA
MVHNVGSFEYTSYLFNQPNFINFEENGLHPPITLDGVPIEDWSSCPIDLSKASIHKLAKTTSATDPSNLNLSSPGVYIGYFNASELADTFFYSTGWNKGQLFINGYNMGRYWSMMTLYVPKPYIKKRNVVVMIDLLEADLGYIEFVDHHIFKFKNTTVSTLE